MKCQIDQLKNRRRITTDISLKMYRCQQAHEMFNSVSHQPSVIPNHKEILFQSEG